MEYKNKEDEIARRMVALDDAAYKSCRSKLGKLFTVSEAAAVKQINDELDENRMKLLHNQLALISNMINTLEEGPEYEELEKEYLEILALVDSYEGPDHRPDVSMSDFGFQERYKKSDSKHMVIAIGREFGSGGHEIGYKLAQELGISFFDKEIFELASKDMGLDDKTMEKSDEQEDNSSFAGKLFGKKKASFFGISTSDAMFFKQSEMICEIARHEDCIILGRCADVVLEKEGIACHSIYIGAPFDARVRRKMMIEEISEKEARELVEQMDKQRKNYYNHYTGRKWGHAGNYDLCVNSAAMGIEGTVKLIKGMITETRY